MPSTFEDVREVTGKVRSPHEHGCKPVEVVPGVWTAHFHDIKDAEALKAVCPNITKVINCACDKCDTKTGSYGEGVEVLRIEGLLDDPNDRKEVDCMPEGPEKEEAKKALKPHPPEECAGDAKKDFAKVIKAVQAAQADGGATMIHCYASLSRSVAFILAYMMKTDKLTVPQAAKQMKEKWGAVWPNDTFVKQLLEYEDELGITGIPGVVHMKVTTKKKQGFYVNAAKSFFTGVDGKDGTKKEPVCVLHISGLGDAVNIAIAAATAVESADLGTITKIETSYPELKTGGAMRGQPRIMVTLYHK